MKIKKMFMFPVMLLSLLAVACGNGGGGGPSGGGGSTSDVYNVDGPNKTKITVFNFGGGIGQEWIKNAAERFAKEKAEHSYATGKKGVYITFLSSFESKTSSMASSNTSIYFDERFSDVQELAQQGLLLNLDEIVKDTSREGGSLESKIFASARDGLQVQGSYYGLPHYEYYGGLTYNRAIFDDKLAYFASETATDKSLYPTKYGEAYFVNSLQTVKSVGPDGRSGTEDDGLPRTLEEFLILCAYLKEQGVPPLVLSGQYQKYGDYILSGFWSTLAGKQQMTNYYNCVGEIEVVDRNADGSIKLTNENLFPGIDYVKKPVTKMVTMNSDGTEGYLGNDMAAKYYAISMLEIFKKEDFFNRNSSISTTSHYDAQKCLYLGGLSDTYDKAAMLVEGSYWYNESREMGCFTQYEKYTKKSAKDLDLRWMSLPTAFDDNSFEGKEQCLVDIGHSYALVNGNIKNNPEIKAICLDFLSFLYSEKELIEFSSLTGMPRMIDYPINVETLANYSSFYSRLFKMRNADITNVIGLSGTTKVFKEAKSLIKIELESNAFRDSTGRYALQLVAAGDHAAKIFDAFSIKKASWVYSN